MSDILDFPHRPRPQLVPGSGEGIPAELRQLALDIEGGSFAGTDAMMVIMYGEGGIVSFPIGRDISTIEGLGMLEMAKAEMLDGVVIEFAPDAS